MDLNFEDVTFAYTDENGDRPMFYKGINLSIRSVIWDLGRNRIREIKLSFS